MSKLKPDAAARKACLDKINEIRRQDGLPAILRWGELDEGLDAAYAADAGLAELVARLDYVTRAFDKLASEGGARSETLIAENERLQVQLAGCLIAAEGATAPEHVATPEMYGWSLVYQRTLDLRLERDALAAQVATLREALELALEWAAVSPVGGDMDRQASLIVYEAARAALAATAPKEAK